MLFEHPFKEEKLIRYQYFMFIVTMSKILNAIDARYGEEAVKYNRNKIDNRTYLTIGVREWWVKEKNVRNGSS